MSMSPETIADMEAGLTRIVCINVIRHAAEMLDAEPISDEEAARFDYYGADKALMYDELTHATRDQQHSFERWQCCHAIRQALESIGRQWSINDLHLVDCIQWILRRCEEEEGPEETVTLDEVMNVLLGTEAAR